MIELILTIEPPPVLAICSAASLVPRKTLVWLTAMMRFHPSNPSGSPTELPEIPALLTRMSRLPQVSTVLPISASQSGSLVTSIVAEVASPPPARISAATASACSWRISATTTLAPSWAKSRASASPIPCAAPVTIATLSCRRMGFLLIPLSASSYALYWRQTEAVARRKIAMIVGNGDYRYRVIADWAKLPEGWSFKEVGGVGVDSEDNVYVFNRGEHPMMIFDREGNFLRSWGEGQYPRAHGVHMAPDDTMFLTDDGGHFVRKVTLEGKVLLELGVPGKPAPFMSGEPFHRCTHTALSPKGEIYVSDGYGNSRVHKYTPDGKLLLSWGEPGTGEGEFNIVHNICCDADGWVYVADHENHRVQVFDGNGKFETQWQNLHRPCGLCMPYGHNPIFYVGEVGPAAAVSRDIPNLGPRVSIVDHQGKLIGRFGETPAGFELGKFLAPHGLAVDSRGDVYVGEVSWTAWPQIYPDTPRPDHISSLQKFEKVG